jgi:hypothetical protein
MATWLRELLAPLTFIGAVHYNHFNTNSYDVVTNTICTNDNGEH